MEILTERKRIREEAIQKARTWAEDVPFKVTAILVGSYARGDFNLWSDIDVMVIAEFNSRPVERLKNIDYPAGFEMIPLTPKEFRRLLEKKDPLALEALSIGIVLRDDLNAREYAKDILSSAKGKNI